MMLLAFALVPLHVRARQRVSAAYPRSVPHQEEVVDSYSQSAVSDQADVLSVA